MFILSNSVFQQQEFKNCNVIFVADYFANELIGGAELTTEALIEATPTKIKVEKIKSKNLTPQLILDNLDKHFVICNFSELNIETIKSLISNANYSIIEYDYKFCKYRSIDKHIATEGYCNCHNENYGLFISSFFSKSKNIFWMSSKQKSIYLSRFPVLEKCSNFVLSSVFTKETLIKLDDLYQKRNNPSGTIVLGSDSWVKGQKAALDWCKENNITPKVLWGLSYDKMLSELSNVERLVYLPSGSDTCPRLTIEALLLGVNLVLNNNVQHKDEEWFTSIEKAKDYLNQNASRFWDQIDKTIWPSISGYTTTLNCIEREYPFKECIKSMLQFCNEVIVVDGGSTDNTLKELILLKCPKMKNPLTGSRIPVIEEVLSNIVESNFNVEHVLNTSWSNWIEENKLKIVVIKRDWNHPRSAVFDGVQKAEARKLCTSDFCWQMDVDEIIHEDDVSKVKLLLNSIPNNVDILSLPVIEYWGGHSKVRIDVTPWKWRLSRNLQNITHGIPVELRCFDADGNLYSAPGSDGCDMIDANTGIRLQHTSFYSQDADNARILALNGNVQMLNAYENWFNVVLQKLPAVHHYSWFDLNRKIRLYRDFWTRHWSVLNGEDYVDSAETNMMFDYPWSSVTNEMIDELALKLATIGGWVWHKKWRGEKTPSIHVKCSPPALMRNK